ncbi:nucleotide exchange factor GrpE [Alicyclobacillus tolerans]|uniref:Protein GrpE n=1 Tax=Alicyclobacillus tolerans TaxID=90970 RepID=A0ABT9LSY0_9BACL|nr:nucleotide exchange factor GrpE [Alicyclobacillus tengchongensis]MDP9727369.1 molecular chaperone GrpE [Alicyclobacillus tengchongensis]
MSEEQQQNDFDASEENSNDERVETADAVQSSSEEPIEAGNASGLEEDLRIAEEPDMLGKLQSELEETRQQLLRTMADFDNFRRRVRQEREELVKSAARTLLAELLPVLDNFDRALPALEQEGVSEQVSTGIGMVHRQLQTLLQKQGVERMEPLHQPFNPEFHDAVLQEAASEEYPSGTVVEVLQAGYLLNGKVLRPAMVKVTM